MSEALQYAREARAALVPLFKQEEFNLLFKRMGEHAGKMGEQILTDDSLSPEQREALRNQRLGFLMAVNYPAEGLQAAESIIMQETKGSSDKE